MNAISVCDGISAASVACEGLGYDFLLLSEIEAFPRSVLRQRQHAVEQQVYTPLDSAEGRPVLWGDFTTLRPRHLRRLYGHADVDVLWGGTPCQSYSVAGKRGGLDDPRGELSLEYALAAYRLGVRWFCWENVPGVFSSADGKDFAAILSAFTGRVVEVPAEGWQNSGILAESGPGHFGIAWGISDAQYAGVPQRRRRVFVVGHLGDWRCAAAVLFDQHSLQGHPAPRRESGQGVAPTISARPTGGGGLGTDFDLDGGLIAGTLQSNGKAAGSATQQDAEAGLLVPLALGGNNTAGPIQIAAALNACSSPSGRLDFDSETFIAHAIQAGALRTNPASGPDGIGVQADVAYTLEARSEVQAVAFRAAGQDGFTPDEVCPPLANTDGGGAGVPTIAFDCKASGRNGFGVGSIAPTLRAMGHKDTHSNAGGQVAVCFDTTQITSTANYSNPQPGDPCHPLAVGQHAPAIAISGRVRGDDGRGYDRAEHMSVEVTSTLDGVKVDRVLGPFAMAVRRLTPRECERLQGFPDDYTLVTHRTPARWSWKRGRIVRAGKSRQAEDGPRYKALGNSWAVPCARRIAIRIKQVDALLQAAQ